MLLAVSESKHSRKKGRSRVTEVEASTKDPLLTINLSKAKKSKVVEYYAGSTAAIVDSSRHGPLHIPVVLVKANSEPNYEITNLSADLFVELPEPKPSLSLDFRNPLFRLDSLNSLSDFVSIESIVQLDVSGNRLRSLRLEQQYSSVELVIASNNILSSVDFISPTIRVLVLDNNKISTLPNLAGLRKLQHLDVNNNELEGSFRMFKHLPSSLQFLAFGNNRFSFEYASELANEAGYLRRLKRLTSLVVVGNPFMAISSAEDVFVDLCTHLETLNGSKVDVARVQHALVQLTHRDYGEEGTLIPESARTSTHDVPPDSKGRTGIMWAAFLGHHDMLPTLLASSQAEINAVDEHDMTALMWACLRGEVECVSLLLQHHAFVDLQDAQGRTAAMHACRAIKNAAAVLAKLVATGANLKLVSKTGASVVDLAERSDVREVLSGVIERTDVSHQTPHSLEDRKKRRDRIRERKLEKPADDSQRSEMARKVDMVVSYDQPPKAKLKFMKKTFGKNRTCLLSTQAMVILNSFGETVDKTEAVEFLRGVVSDVGNFDTMLQAFEAPQEDIVMSVDQLMAAVAEITGPEQAEDSKEKNEKRHRHKSHRSKSESESDGRKSQSRLTKHRRESRTSLIQDLENSAL